jgi:hypothetical protein
VWDEDVEAPLARAWIAGNSQTRNALSYIANWIDSHLATDPDLKGQPFLRLEARQIEIPIPGSMASVTAIYHVLPEDRLVRVSRLVFRIV